MKKAFSLMELSIVILIIGILVAGITQSSRLVSQMRIASARTLTNSSPVSSIKNLALWLEPTSENSFATGTSSYTNIVEMDDNAAIGRWNDINPQSTSKNHATQATAGNQPLYVANALNGLPGVKFDGSNDYLSSTVNIDYTVSPNITIFVVFRRTSNTPSMQTILGQDNGGFDRNIFVYKSPSPGFASGTSVSTLTGIDAFDKPTMISLTVQNGVSGGSQFFLNKSSVTSFTDDHPNSGTSTTQIGSGYNVGTNPINGLIFEVIIYDRVLKNEERQSVENYLSQKWGLR